MAYIVTNNTFKPYSYDELIAPIRYERQREDAQASILNAAAEHGIDPEYLPEGSNARAKATDANKKLAELRDALYTKGYSRELAKQIQEAAIGYKNTMTAIAKAQDEYKKEMEYRRKNGTGFLYKDSTPTIDSFLSGAAFDDPGISLARVRESAASESVASAKNLKTTSEDRVKTQANPGYKISVDTNGFTKDQINTVFKGLDQTDEEWAATLSTVDSTYREAIDNLRNSYQRMQVNMGYGQLTNEADKEEFRDAMRMGAYTGILGTTETKTPDPDYEKSKEKREFEAKYPWLIYNTDGTTSVKPGWEMNKNGKYINTEGMSNEQRNAALGIASGNKSGASYRDNRGIRKISSKGVLVGKYGSISEMNQPGNGGGFKGFEEVRIPDVDITISEDEDTEGNAIDSLGLSDESYRYLAAEIGYPLTLKKDDQDKENKKRRKGEIKVHIPVGDRKKILEQLTENHFRIYIKPERGLLRQEIIIEDLLPVRDTDILGGTSAPTSENSEVQENRSNNTAPAK